MSALSSSGAPVMLAIGVAAYALRDANVGDAPWQTFVTMTGGAGSSLHESLCGFVRDAALPPLIRLGRVSTLRVLRREWNGVAAREGLAWGLGALVLTFLLLMRSGYRWARTLLSGGGISTIIYTLASLFTVSRQPVAAIVFAVTGIVGSVLIGGGMYLLHRQDGHGFFTR